MSRILIVEDSEVIRVSVAVALKSIGHEVLALEDGEGFETALARFRPNLVILDVMLPGGRDGFELLAVTRKLSDSGVIMVTARSDLTDRVRGLREGADDYLGKPFSSQELMARVEAVLRRSDKSGLSITVGGYTIADNASIVTYDDEPINLTETERRLLSELAKQLDRVVSKAQLLTAVWGYDGYDENIVEVHISSLRRHLEEAGPRIIHTVRGRGYRLGER